MGGGVVFAARGEGGRGGEARAAAAEAPAEEEEGTDRDMPAAQCLCTMARARDKAAASALRVSWDGVDGVGRVGDKAVRSLTPLPVPPVLLPAGEISVEGGAPSAAAAVAVAA